MAIQPTCFTRFSTTIGHHPKKSAALYLIVMAVFFATLFSLNIPTNIRAIVGYSMAGLHLPLFLLGCCVYRAYHAHKQRVLAEIDEDTNAKSIAEANLADPEKVKVKTRADKQMSDLFATAKDVKASKYTYDRVKQGQFSDDDLSDGAIRGYFEDPLQPDTGYECEFYVVRCSLKASGEVFLFSFHQRHFVKDHSDGEFYICIHQGNRDNFHLFNESFDSFTAANFADTERYKSLENLLNGNHNAFELVRSKK